MKNSTRTKKNQKQAEPVVVKELTFEEKMMDEVKSLDRASKHCKENIIRHIQSAINRMKNIVEDAERSVLRVEKGYDKVEDLSKEIVHTFGWGYANAIGSVTTAISYTNEHLTYKNQLETLIKHVPAANEANNQLIAQEALKLEQARIAKEEKEAAEAKAKEDEIHLNFGSLDNEFIGLDGLGNPVHVIKREKQELKEDQVVKIEGTDYILKDNRWQALLETFLQGALQNKENNL